MHYVYILISRRNPQNHYVGITNDVKRRLSEHNDLNYSSFSNRYAPWKLKTFIAVEDKDTAQKLEIYFKSHSGKAFLKKRLI